MVFRIKILISQMDKNRKGARRLYNKEVGRDVLNLRWTAAAFHLSIYFDEIVENPISARGTCDLWCKI